MEDYVICIKNARVDFKNFSLQVKELNIEQGYIVGITGDNGAGKTTFINMLLGNFVEMQGSVRVCELDVLKDRIELMKQVGMISNSRVFFMEKDALENERLYSIYYPNWDEEEYRKKLEQFSLNLAVPLKSYSTGEYVKFQLAFAAAYKPKVLLLDEPTANLDSVFRDDFLKTLQEFVAEYETTILLSTHLNEDLSKIADFIINIDNGVCSMKEVEI